MSDLSVYVARTGNLMVRDAGGETVGVVSRKGVVLFRKEGVAEWRLRNAVRHWLD